MASASVTASGSSTQADFTDPPRIRVGCAGWSIGTPQRSLFGEGSNMLERYSTRLDAVEINSSFHRSHRHATYMRWAESVPAGFRFSAKLPRTITHQLALRRAGAPLDRFVSEVAGLGDKLGCVLVQLPPGLAFEARVAATFFAMLRRRWHRGVACEPRHPSWFAPAAEALLCRHGIARVAADPPRFAEAAHVGGDATLRYWRWHGAPRMYYSAYDDGALSALADAVAADTRGAEAWVIFDNTAQGHAVPNALELRRRLRRPLRSRRSRSRPR